MKINTTSLQGMQLMGRNQKFSTRLEIFEKGMATLPHTYLRTIVSPAGREVVVEDRLTGKTRNMLMFASNNYLDLANHPTVKARVQKAIEEYGCGIGGPPLLNGYIKIIREAEERLASMKGDEDALIFSSGFMANLGVIGALAQQDDLVLFDERSHAPFYDGTKLSKAKSLSFKHNDVENLELMLNRYSNEVHGTLFVCVEGVYSMDGNTAPLDKIAPLCRRYDAQLIVDDAHGTGVLGEYGRGTAYHLNCNTEVDITMGTFSKAFATCGGFITGSRSLIHYLRFYARSYIFSASVPPPVVAAVLGGLDVMENEPSLRLQLLENVAYAVEKLKGFELCAPPEAAIISLKLPPRMDLKKAALEFHRKNIFINPIESPAVPLNHERFRISFMATHTKDDINRLADAVDEVWANPEVYSS
jgi:glycine C-acetyltransferase